MKVRVTLMTENDVPVEKLGENPLEKIKGAWDTVISLLSALMDGDTCEVEKVEIMEDTPPTKVRAVAQGTWQKTPQSLLGEQCQCSVCGETFWGYMSKFPFCPNCGADMRAEGSGTDV